MECIRDLDMDMEKECLKLGYAGPEKGHTLWSETISGREYGRIHSWGAGPKRGVGRAAASVREFESLLQLLTSCTGRI